MMVQIGVGLAPRAPHALQTQPVQGLTLVVASDNASVAVTLEVNIPYLCRHRLAQLVHENERRLVLHIEIPGKLNR